MTWRAGYQVFEDPDYSGILRYIVRHPLTVPHQATFLQQDSALFSFDYCARDSRPTRVDRFTGAIEPS
jgi:hypothetical protein